MLFYAPVRDKKFQNSVSCLVFSTQHPWSACGLLSNKQYAVSPLNTFLGITPVVVADGHHGGAHESDARTATEGWEVEKEHHLEEHATLKFHETAVGYRIGEGILHVLPDKEQIVVLEFTEWAELKHD